MLWPGTTTSVGPAATAAPTRAPGCWPIPAARAPGWVCAPRSSLYPGSASAACSGAPCACSASSSTKYSEGGRFRGASYGDAYGRYLALVVADRARAGHAGLRLDGRGRARSCRRCL